MKKILLLAMLVSITLSAFASPTIYAYQTWEPNKNPALRGPVKFDAEAPGRATLLADQSDLGVCYSGFYLDYKWYAQAIKPGSQSSVEGFYTIDMNTGERTLISTKSTKKMVDMDYDYSRNRVLGITDSGEALGELNIETGEVSSLGYFKYIQDNQYVYLYAIALAVSKDGTIYIITTDDNLYTVDIETALCTAVGYTGVNAAFDQTMGFDHNTGVLYWVNNGDYHLYTLNLSTGAATDLGEVGVNGPGSIAGLFVPYVDAPIGAPNRVTNRKATENNGNVTLSWTNPSTDAQGNPLTELTGVKIVRNDVTIATVSELTIGQEATYTDQNVADGNYLYKLIPVNSKGDGGVDAEPIEVVIGPNAPGAVHNFTATSGDGCAILTWQAPTEGLNGGEYNPADLKKYVITRLGGSTEVEFEITDPTATSYSDVTSFGNYTYKIVAYNSIGKGAEVMSNSVMVKPADWIVMGQENVAIETGKLYTFYDDGTTGLYSNSRNYTLTISPKDPDSYVTARFKSFSLDTYGDKLEVYNGASTDAPKVGSFAATTVPIELVELVATNPEGALTFVFTSDVMSRDSGWEADVEAVEKCNNDLEARSITANLYPSVNTAVAYTVNVANKGSLTASNYKVLLVDANDQTLAETNGIELASMANSDITINYTPIATGELVVKAKIVFDGDEDLTNNTTAQIVQTVVAEGSKFIQIINEDSSNLYVLPMSFMNNESIGQTIYPASRIGVESGMNLKMIQYTLNNCTNSYENVALTIWVGETADEYLLGDPVPANNLTKVFDSTVNVVSGDTNMIIPLSTNYEYKGSNLVVLVHKHSLNTNNSGVTFRGTFGSYDATKYCSRFASAWDDSEHLDPNGVFGSGGSTMMPDIDLLFVPSDNSGVENIHNSDNNAPVIYYNLQGVPVANPENGIFIRVQGTKATKVIL